MLVKGGGKKKNKGKMGFKPVEDMIVSVGTKFRMLTADSLFGFMVIMDVLPDKSEYGGLSSTYRSLSRPITTYLLKLAVISSQPFHYLQPAVRIPGGSPPFCKASETPVNLYREATIQQRVWLDSIVGGRIPVCPDVYGFSVDAGDSIFGGAHTTSKYGRRDETHFEDCYDFLHAKSRVKHAVERHREDYTIGAIAMEYIPNSRILHDILHLGGIFDLEDKTTVCISAGAQVLRLFLDHSILHFDLHAGNILATEEGNAFIIDFGMVLDITNLSRDDIYRLSTLFAESIQLKQAEFKSQVHAIQHESPSVKAVWCKGMFTFFRLIEEGFNGRFQMNGLNTVLLDYFLHAAVFDKYMELTVSESTSLSRAFIEKKVKSGDLEIIYDEELNTLLNTELPPSYPRINTVSGHLFDTPPVLVAPADEHVVAPAVVATATIADVESFENAIGIHKRKKTKTKTNGRRRKRPTNQTKRKIK
jgi:hypothetical protein